MNKILQPLQPVAVSPLIFGKIGGRSRDTRSRSSPVCHRREDVLFAEVVFLIRRVSLIYQTHHYRNDNFVLFFSLYAAEAPWIGGPTRHLIQRLWKKHRFLSSLIPFYLSNCPWSALTKCSLSAPSSIIIGFTIAFPGTTHALNRSLSLMKKSQRARRLFEIISGGFCNRYSESCQVRNHKYFHFSLPITTYWTNPI